MPDITIHFGSTFQRNEEYLAQIVKITETGSVKSLAVSKIAQVTLDDKGKKQMTHVEDARASDIRKLVKMRLAQTLETMKNSGKQALIDKMAHGDKISDDELENDDEKLLAAVFFLGTKRKENIMLGIDKRPAPNPEN